MLCVPAVVHVTVAVLSPVVPPVVIVPPAIVQAYPVMLASVVYTFPAEPEHAVALPVIVGTGNAFSVNVTAVLILLIHPEAICLVSAK
jgi:hypothetical protein